jgi:hypothetical protein
MARYLHGRLSWNASQNEVAVIAAGEDVTL